MSEARVVKMRRWGYDPASEIEVTLTPAIYAPDREWVVVVGDREVGRVGRYVGSLDRKIGRLRSPGKSRTLWWSRRPGPDSRSIHGHVSRAEAIRWLL